MSSIEEPTFIKAYLSLLKTAGPKVLADDYVNTDLAAKPLLVMPNMPNKKQRKTDKSTQSSPVTVNLKSIRPPKFSTKEVCESTDTVFTVKERLLGDPEGQLYDQGYSVDDIKFVVKGKVVANSKILSEVTAEGEVTFTVMIQKPQPKAEQDEPEPEVATLPELSQSLWNRISDVLRASLGEQSAAVALKKLQEGYSA